MSADDCAKITVDIVIFTLLRGVPHLLLVRRSHEPYAGYWAIPGGPVQVDESLDMAARRQLAAQTSVRDVYLEQLYTFGDPERDPRGRVISVAYIALIRSGYPNQDTGSAPASAQWFPVAALPRSLAFDHALIVAYACGRLRAKLEYTPLAFQLLPAVFTLPELKRTYEQILGEPLDRGNFYRKIKAAGIVEPSGGLRVGQGRPARLYHFKAEPRIGDFVFRWREARPPDAED